MVKMIQKVQGQSRKSGKVAVVVKTLGSKQLVQGPYTYLYTLLSSLEKASQGGVPIHQKVFLKKELGKGRVQYILVS